MALNLVEPRAFTVPGNLSPLAALVWVRHYVVDWAAQAAHDFKLPGAFTDTGGATWDPATASFQNTGSASAIDIVPATGLVTTTSATADIVMVQDVQALLPSYSWLDRILWVVHMTSADQVANTQVCSARFGADPFGNGAHQIFRASTGGPVTRQNRRQSTGGGNNSNFVTLAAALSDVMALEITGDSCLPYYGAALSAGSPLTDLTAGEKQSILRNPDTPTLPFQDSDATVQMSTNRNGPVNFTTTYRAFELWRLEARDVLQP